MAGQLQKDFSEYEPVSKNLYVLQKLADSKVLSSKLISAYHKMADPHVTGSINVRRNRRQDALVMIIEDDRFTASYAASILNKQYDMVHAKTGEDAILTYIENAPDIVFVDIHLPGISGHQTLNAIRRIDPEAYAIMLSVDTEKTNVVSASSNGAQGFLKKPFSKDRLLATVQKSPFVRRVKSSGNPAQTDFY
jgi:CheY-like chemotaxis protein